MKTVLMVATTASMIDEFNLNNILILQKLKCKIIVACNFESGNSTSEQRIEEFKQFLKENGITQVQIDFPRSPFNLSKLILSYKQLEKLRKGIKIDLIHCHTPVGGVVARYAFRHQQKKHKCKVIYTAHGFHFFKGAPLFNWMTYYLIESLCSYSTDLLITINHDDYLLSKRRLHAFQNLYIPGVGIDTNKLLHCSSNKDKRKELQIPDDAFVILSVGEVNRNKNHKVIIKALSQIEDQNIYYILAGKGKLIPYLNKLSLSLGLGKQVKILGYCDDIPHLIPVCDIFAFPSKREGLGLAALEAMAEGKPIITTNIGGIKDYSENGKTGFCVKPSDVKGYAEAIISLRDNVVLRKQMGDYNKSVVKKYDIENVNKIMLKAYSDMLGLN